MHMDFLIGRETKEGETALRNGTGNEHRTLISGEAACGMRKLMRI